MEQGNEYVYHGTSRGAAYRIKKYGKMSIGQASGSPDAPLFFSNQEQYALTYAQRKDSSGGVLFRIKRTPDMKVNNSIIKRGKYVEYYTYREVPAGEIEVKTKDGWIPLENFDIISEQKEEKKLEYRIEHMGSHSGQQDLELGLYIDNEIIGMVQYTLYDGELTIGDIVVRPEYRRQGFGSKMMKYIKNEHPEFKYRPSMKTDLGAKFIHKDIDLKEDKDVSKEYLKQLSNIQTSKLAKKFLDRWANRGPGHMVSLSNREEFIFNGIKRDGKVPMTNERIVESMRNILKEGLKK